MSLTCTIAGVAANISAISRPDTIDQKTVCTVTVIDLAGTAVYQRGQPIVVTDSILGTIFTGFIHNPQAIKLYPNPGLQWTMDCVQKGDYLAGKRTSNKSYANQYAGVVAVDQVQRYGSAEGLSANAVLRWDELQSDWASGTLSGTVATTNAPDGNPGGGDLELALAGAPVTLSLNASNFLSGNVSNCSIANGVYFHGFVSGALTPNATNAIKIQGTQSVPGNGNSYTYVKIWTGTYAIQSWGFYFNYDIWLDPSCPEAKIGVDFVCTDGTTFRDNPSADVQNLSCHPNTDLKGVAVGQWYHRSFYGNNLSGKTVAYVSVAIEGDTAGTYTGWIKNINFSNGNYGYIYSNIYDGSQTLQFQQLQTNGYSHVSVTIVPTYDLFQYNPQLVGTTWISTQTQYFFSYPIATYSASVDAVKILQSSYLSWQSNDPANTQTVVSYSLDGWGAIQASNNAPLPDLPAGLNLAGRTLTINIQFFFLPGVTSPEQAPALSSLTCMLNSAYNATKTDTALLCTLGSDWNSGTYMNTMPSYLNDIDAYSTRSWASTSDTIAGQDLYSASGTSAQAATANGLQITCGANSDARVRLTYAKQTANGSISAQIQVSANASGGVVYRCSNWGPNNDSYAYSATLTTTQLLVARGSNSSGAGAYTQLASFPVNFTAGSWHTLRITFTGSSHIIFLDTPYPVYQVTDSTYLGSGYCGLRAYNSTASTQSMLFNSALTLDTKALSLNGITRNWDDASDFLQSFWTNSASGQTANAKAFQLTTPAGGEARSRMDMAGQFANFVLDVDVNITSSSKAGVVYRTTGWSNYDSNYAYAVEVTTTSIALQKGSNSSQATNGTRTQIGSATISLSSGNWHHLQLIINGSSHQIYLDNILMLSVTDSTYTAAGFVGLRSTTTAAYAQQFDNFGVVSALSGTWTSGPLALSSVGTYGKSVISWRDQSADTSNCSILVQASLDGGSTWQNCTNGGVIPNFTANQPLAGKSLQVKVTLTTTTANAMPAIDNLNVQVLGAYSSSGTRVSPALSLNPVTEAGSSLVSWNANTPTGTSVALATSPDGSTWTPVTSGAAIPGITTRPAPVLDNFSSDTSSNYTVGQFAGGYFATWTYDTANTRLVVTGGKNSIFLRNSLVFSDANISCDMDYSDGAGLVLNSHDNAGVTDIYYVSFSDSSAINVPNSMQLSKRVSGVITTLSTVSLASFGGWTRGAPKRFKFSKLGGVLNVYMDGTLLTSYTDASPLAAGQAGLYQLLGGKAQFYNLRIEGVGQNLAGQNVYTKVTLNSTDPTVTPQMLNMQTFVSSPDINAGSLIPSVDYQRTFLDANIGDLSKKSNYWSYFNGVSLIFQARQATPAPFVLSSLNSQTIAGQTIYDVLLDGAELDNSGDAYRNRQIMKGAIAITSYTEIKSGDGSTRSWNVSHPLQGAPTITLNGQMVSIGVKNVDTGKQFYYQIDATAIDQDSSQTVLQATDVLSITYDGSSVQDVVLDNTSMPGTITQAMMAAIEGGGSSGVVEAVLDLSGTNTTVDAATAQGNQLLQRYGTIGRTFKCKTLRSGLRPGMQIPLFVPEFGLSNVQMLITEVDISPQIAPSVPGGILYTWQLTMMEGPNLGTWVQLFLNAFS